MESARTLPNQLKAQRVARGWSQAELAHRAGISRTAVSAIEGRRLVPSVAAALALARVLECSVEELFGVPASRPATWDWAWLPPQPQWRYWQAEVGGRTLLFPVESSSPTAALPHDGQGEPALVTIRQRPPVPPTLVLACCDPAAGLLSTLYAQTTGFRLIAIPRSSQQAVELLAQGLVHVAGLHLSTDTEDRNAAVAHARLGEDYRLLRVATWQEGLAVARGRKFSSIRSLVKSRPRWVGREPGSGARQCLDELLRLRTAFRRTAHDHRGVAESIRSGWADAGVCLRLTCEESGLTFLSLRDEYFELCYLRRNENDPRILALLRVVRSAEYRRLLADLPGYDASFSGELR